MILSPIADSTDEREKVRASLVSNERRLVTAEIDAARSEAGRRVEQLEKRMLELTERSLQARLYQKEKQDRLREELMATEKEKGSLKEELERALSKIEALEAANEMKSRLLDVQRCKVEKLQEASNQYINGNNKNKNNTRNKEPRPFDWLIGDNNIRELRKVEQGNKGVGSSRKVELQTTKSCCGVSLYSPQDTPRVFNSKKRKASTEEEDNSRKCGLMCVKHIIQKVSEMMDKGVKNNEGVKINDRELKQKYNVNKDVQGHYVLELMSILRCTPVSDLLEVQYYTKSWKPKEEEDKDRYEIIRKCKAAFDENVHEAGCDTIEALCDWFKVNKGWMILLVHAKTFARHSEDMCHFIVVNNYNPVGDTFEYWDPDHPHTPYKIEKKNLKKAWLHDKTDRDVMTVKTKGKAVYVWPNGDKYDGEWKDLKKHGQGTLTLDNGNKYAGEWKNGNAHNGKFTWTNGDKYEGEWKDDKKHGQGTLTLDNGDTYEGEWKNGNVHGNGEFVWTNGDKYKGKWKDDKRHGKGTLTQANGDTYEGKWKDDKRHGKGTLTQANGDTYEGEWKDDKRHGKDSQSG